MNLKDDNVIHYIWSELMKNFSFYSFSIINFMVCLFWVNVEIIFSVVGLEWVTLNLISNIRNLLVNFIWKVCSIEINMVKWFSLLSHFNALLITMARVFLLFHPLHFGFVCNILHVMQYEAHNIMHSYRI